MFIKLKILCKKTLELRNQLRTALRFNNKQKISEYSYELAVVNSHIVDLVIDGLERVEKASPNNTISSSISGNVQTPENSPMKFNGIDWFWRK